MRVSKFILVLILPGAAFGQAKRTTLDGVFSGAQADRGSELFAAKCARCHEGADVDGPPLAGDPFVDRWREDSLQPLYRFVRTKMPQDAPGSLTESNYLDLLTAILAKNMYPPGKDLVLDGLATVVLVGRDGPKPIPNNSAVVAVGCFDGASLTKVGDLGRTQSPDETSPEEKKESAAKALGSGTLKLTGEVNASVKGSKVQAKGVLQRQSAGDRINVLSFEVLASSCP